MRGEFQDVPVKWRDVMHALNGDCLKNFEVWGGRFKHSAHHNNNNQSENQKSLMFIRKPNLHLILCNHLRVLERVFMYNVLYHAYF